MNGPTNFMLSKMEGEGADYAVVLKEAQDLGFAEADPSADVDGYDVRAKVSILAKLAFGTTVELDNVPMTGITRVSSNDFAYAKQMNCTVKLLGVARMVDNRLSVFVSPMMVPLDNAVGTTSGATNIVEIRSESLQSSSFVGQGAGRFPTANSVMSDILAVAQGRGLNAPFQRQTKRYIDNNFTARFYIRLQCKDGLGVIREVGELCEQHGVSIHAINQTPITDFNDIPVGLVTEEAQFNQVDQLCDSLQKCGFCLERPLAMPFLDA